MSRATFTFTLNTIKNHLGEPLGCNGYYVAPMCPMRKHHNKMRTLSTCLQATQNLLKKLYLLPFLTQLLMTYLGQLELKTREPFHFSILHGFRQEKNCLHEKLLWLSSSDTQFLHLKTVSDEPVVCASHLLRLQSAWDEEICVPAKQGLATDTS